MKEVKREVFTGERALFFETDLSVQECSFQDGESPLKHSKRIQIADTMFKWKYPLWYSEDVVARHCTFFETARAGIWYTKNISLENTVVEAPKMFRRSEGIRLQTVSFPNGSETLWACRDVTAQDISVTGDYFGMNSERLQIDGMHLVGNYAFDGAKDVVVKNSRLLTKDAFWNSENVTVYNSFIAGEYLGWNSRNLTLVGCTVESLQGFCYIENLVLKGCKLFNTTLAFEYCSVDAEIDGKVDSILNPSSGKICADEIGELTLDGKRIDPSKTTIIIKKGGV